ncbi:hypothetical protein [Candidatus Viridilinea mediisalina]|uniref:Uncharacterized protein n=1 Tax=Candidatus Viridilinea mediisalina TaxID=2024553 RepID=A0A2A6RI48_9CHLR|nr:hypothetical protein [Candidatus Viridilinea mediisalina]PDW02692.1 hypothetical protein CJ255_12605 [Candidatus Viridilinea mediisalina]
MTTSISIARLLTEAGFVNPEAQTQARAIMESFNLTNPRKQQIAADKLPRVRALFNEQLRLTCGDPDCEALAKSQWPEKQPIQVSPEACVICANSSQQRAARLLAAAMDKVGYHHLLILGGTPPQHTTLRELLNGTPLSIRAVNGSGRAHSATEASRQLAWADMMVIWASTPLHHKISVPYTSQAPAGMAVITVPRRGVESLCRGIIEALP